MVLSGMLHANAFRLLVQAACVAMLTGATVWADDEISIC